MQNKAEVSQILNTSVAVLTANASAFLMFSGLMTVIAKLLTLGLGFDHIVAAAATGEGDFSELPGGPFGGLVIMLLIAMVPYVFALAAITRGTVAYLSGDPVTVGECLTVCVRRAPDIILLSVLTGFGVLVAGFFLVIPAVILIVFWYLAPPALIEENITPIRSLGRSIELTRGNRWTVFALLFILVVLTFVASVLASTLVPIFGHLVAQIVSVAIEALLAAFGAVVCTVTYCAVQTGLPARIK